MNKVLLVIYSDGFNEITLLYGIEKFAWRHHIYWQLQIYPPLADCTLKTA